MPPIPAMASHSTGRHRRDGSVPFGKSRITTVKGRNIPGAHDHSEIQPATVRAGQSWTPAARAYWPAATATPWLAPITMNSHPSGCRGIRTVIAAARADQTIASTTSSNTCPATAPAASVRRARTRPVSARAAPGIAVYGASRSRAVLVFGLASTPLMNRD